MNHLKIYENIISKAKSEKRIKYKGIYYERHHIIPKCLDGDNSKDNLVLLTAKEHYICHKLLIYIYDKNKKLCNAFCRMTWDRNGKRNISSRDYSYAKELKSHFSEETKQKMKVPHGPMSEEHKLKIKRSSEGRKRSEESKQKQKKTITGKSKDWLKGRITWNKGIKMKEETKDKIRKSSKGISRNKGHKMSEEQKQKLRDINLGKKQSQETIDKRLKTMGEPWNKGKKLKV